VTGAATSDLSQEQMRNTVVPKDNMRQVTISCATISPQNPVLDAKSYVRENNKVECEPKYQPDASRILAVPEVDSIWKYDLLPFTSFLLFCFVLVLLDYQILLQYVWCGIIGRKERDRGKRGSEGIEEGRGSNRLFSTPSVPN